MTFSRVTAKKPSYMSNSKMRAQNRTEDLLPTRRMFLMTDHEGTSAQYTGRFRLGKPILGFLVGE